MDVVEDITLGIEGVGTFSTFCTDTLTVINFTSLHTVPPCAASCWNCLTDLDSSNGQACWKHMQIWGMSQSILLLVLRIAGEYVFF